jgi:ABC-type antimicrobial peptide transport system permease subunit
MPLREVDAKGMVQPEHSTTFLLRMAGTNPMAYATELRKAVAEAHMGIRVSNARTQQELIDAQTVRERMLAMLGMFFATVALLLAGIGLYGVLNYSVLQRRKEIGIRLAVGARMGAIVQVVTTNVLRMVFLGLAAGVGLGLGVARYMEALFFQVKPSDGGVLAIPLFVIVAVTFVAIVPAVLRALRIDPVEILRAE